MRDGSENENRARAKTVEAQKRYEQENGGGWLQRLEEDF